MKRMTKRVIAILLAMVTLCAVGGAVAYADDSDYIYYSDLFYGYDSGYLKSPYLRSYLNDTYQVMTGVRYAYENSP